MTVYTAPTAVAPTTKRHDFVSLSLCFTPASHNIYGIGALYLVSAKTIAYSVTHTFLSAHAVLHAYYIFITRDINNSAI